MTQTMTDDQDASKPVLAADGTPLKQSLNRALRRQKLRALALIAPLLLFILVSFVAPIGDMLFRSVENSIVMETIPRTVRAMRNWEPDGETLPPDEIYAAFYTDFVLAEENKLHTRLGSRLNYEASGMSSLFRSTGRSISKFDTTIYGTQFTEADAAYGDPAMWATWMAEKDNRKALPLTASAYEGWAEMIEDVKDADPATKKLSPIVYTALYNDFASGAVAPSMPAVDVSGFETVSLREQFGAVKADWLDPTTWTVIKTFAGPLTDGYFLNAVDMLRGPDGIEARPESQRIYLRLLWRTIVLSVTITATCIMLGYPVAWLMANLPNRSANVLMILVLLPFWTSLLVRTSAWKVLLQEQGVINDLLVWIGLVGDLDRLQLIQNATGTTIAMTHILLPFMVLPLYSVMKTIPPSYLRAAKSLGANDWTAFWRVYFPQSLPGIGAGSILVFILSIGYYITPELVGGTKGVFISNRIAYHISSSLNWGLAAALGSILLVIVLILYWVYDRLVGIDNVKLGG
nr:ABC transporter permease [Falsihalocynthiibacter arcticus]